MVEIGITMFGDGTHYQDFPSRDMISRLLRSGIRYFEIRREFSKMGEAFPNLPDIFLKIHGPTQSWAPIGGKL